MSAEQLEASSFRAERDIDVVVPISTNIFYIFSTDFTSACYRQLEVHAGPPIVPT
jgi:hypothetical protein